MLFSFLTKSSTVSFTHQCTDYWHLLGRMRSRLATAWRHMEYTGNCSGAWGTHRQFNSQLVSRQEQPIKIKRIEDCKLGTDDTLWREELPTACATKMPLFQWISSGERNSGNRSFFSSGFPDFHVLSRTAKIPTKTDGAAPREFQTASQPFES